jgi:Protein of unknown function (DUF1275)
MTGAGRKEQGPLLLTLAVVTGVVDAVNILQLARVFVANMTGNVVFSAFAVVVPPASRSAPRCSPWPWASRTRWPGGRGGSVRPAGAGSGEWARSPAVRY